MKRIFLFSCAAIAVSFALRLTARAQSTPVPGQTDPACEAVQAQLSPDQARSVLETTLLAKGPGGHEGGNGGAGIYRDGKYLTIGSAKLELSDPLPEDKIPGMELLHPTLSAMELEPHAKVALLRSALPRPDRTYRVAASDSMPKEVEDELLAIYRKLLGSKIKPCDKIVIFAVTIDRETFLLPRFFNPPKGEKPLSPVGRAAILFHESLWAMNPQLTYKTVVDAERLFQRYLENADRNAGYDADLFYLLGQIFGDPAIGIHAGANADLKAGRLKKLLNRRRLLPMSVAFGSSLRIKAECDGDNDLSIDISDLELAKEGIEEQLLRYPDLEVLKQLASVAGAMRADLLHEGFSLSLTPRGKFRCTRDNAFDNIHSYEPRGFAEELLAGSLDVLGVVPMAENERGTLTIVPKDEDSGRAALHLLPAK